MMFFPVIWLLRALKASKIVVDSMRDGDIRPHLYGVQLTQAKSGWSASATNGHWLLYITNGIVVNAVPDEVNEALKGKPEEFFIPARLLTQVIRDLETISKNIASYESRYTKRAKSWTLRDWIVFDLEEQVAHHAFGSISLPDPTGESYPPVIKVLPKYDVPNAETKQLDRGVTPIGLSAYYLSRACEAMAAYYGMQIRSPNFRSKCMRIFTGPTDLDPMLFSPADLGGEMDEALSFSTFRIVIMPMRH